MAGTGCFTLAFQYRGCRYPMEYMPNSHHDIKSPEEYERN